MNDGFRGSTVLISLLILNFDYGFSNGQGKCLYNTTMEKIKSKH